MAKRRRSSLVTGKGGRRGSITETLALEELQAAASTSSRGRRGSVKNFDNTKGTATRDQRFKKIIDWCVADGLDNSIAFDELSVTMRFLARAFNDDESTSMLKHLKNCGFSNITTGTLHKILTSITTDQAADNEKAVKSGKAMEHWSDDKIVKAFIIKFTEALKDPTAGVTDTKHEDELAALKQEIQNLKRSEKTATERYKKLSEHTSSLDQENTEMRAKLDSMSGTLARAKQIEEGTEDSLKSQKELVESFRNEKGAMEKKIKELTQEVSNNTSMLEVERKIKKTSQDELAQLRETVTALQMTRSEANRLALKKKLGMMNAIFRRRQYLFKLQKENQRMPELEAEMQMLKNKVKKLEDEAKEYLRLMDSFKNAPGQFRAMDLPDDSAPMNLALELGDDEELEALQRRIAELERLLAMETMARKKAEEDLAEERAAHEKTKAELAAEQEERKRVEAELEEEVAKNKALEEENATLKEKVTSLEATVAERDAEIVALKAKIAEMEARIAELEAQLADTKAELEAEQAKNRQLEEEIAALKEQVSSLEATVAERDAKIVELEAKIAELEARIADLEAQLAAKVAELEAEQEKNRQLEEEISGLKEKVTSLEATVAERDAEIVELKNKIAELEAALAAALAKIAELEAEIERLRAELADKEMEVVTVIEEKVTVEVVAAPAMVEFKRKLELTPEQQAEVTAYAICMNQHLRSDPDLAHLMPINVETPELLLKVSDGLLLSKWMNVAVAGTIDDRALNMVRGDGELDKDSILDNLNLCLSAGKSIGVTMHPGSVAAEQAATKGMSAEQCQIMECVEAQPSIDFIYELIKTRYTTNVSPRSHPELIEIAETPEIGMSKLKLEDISPKELVGLGPDKILLRWANWHYIAGATGDLPSLIGNWSECANSVPHATLLARVAEAKALDDGSAPVDCTDSSKSDTQRAKFVLDLARKLGVQHFHRPTFLTNGSERLNLLFAATIFDFHTGFQGDDDLVTSGGGVADDPDATAGSMLDSDSREERAFRMWINSCGIPGVFLNNLFMDCRDGLVLLKVEDFIEPGCVNWKKVEMKPNNKFKCVSNCNYAIEIAKANPLSFSLVGIGGPDINEGHEKFILAIVWQLMRYHTMKKLAALTVGGAKIEDADILKWANNQIKEHRHESNPVERLKSFRDAELSNSLFLFNLIWSVEPKIVNWKMVSNGDSPVEKVRNAGYAISVARKLGAEIFLLPHDIVEVKPKMILLFVATLMSVHSERSH